MHVPCPQPQPQRTSASSCLSCCCLLLPPSHSAKVLLTMSHCSEGVVTEMEMLNLIFSLGSLSVDGSRHAELYCLGTKKSCFIQKCVCVGQATVRGVVGSVCCGVARTPSGYTSVTCWLSSPPHALTCRPGPGQCRPWPSTPDSMPSSVAQLRQTLR